MGNEILPASPHRRVQPSSSSSPFNRKLAPAASQSRDSSSATVDLGWRALLRRHQFLLLTLAILTFLCTVYLYFAVTLGNKSSSSNTTDDSCARLTGTQRAACKLRNRVSRKILQLQLNAGENEAFFQDLVRLEGKSTSTVALCSLDATGELQCKAQDKLWAALPDAAFRLIQCTQQCHDVDVGDQRHISELQRILKPGGLVTVPCGSTMSSSLRGFNWRLLGRAGDLEIWKTPETTRRDHSARQQQQQQQQQA